MCQNVALACIVNALRNGVVADHQFLCESKLNQQGTTSKPVVAASEGQIWQKIDRQSPFSQTQYCLN